MTIPSKVSTTVRRAAETADGLRRRAGWSWRGVTALGAAGVAMAGSAIVLVAVSQDVIQSDGLEVHDPSNLAVVTDHRTGLLVHLAKILTDLGSVALLIPLAVVASVLLWFVGARLIVVAAPVLALGVGGAIVGVVKHLVDRGRPPLALHLVNENDASFPSGHATDSAAVYLTIGIVLAVVVFRRPIVRALSVLLALLLAGGIGASRLELGVHWPTDVIAGWALGATVAIVVATVAVLATSLTVPPEEPHGTRWDRLRHGVHRVAVRRRTILPITSV